MTNALIGMDPEANGEIAHLVRQLQDIEDRLRELAGGDIDSVIGTDGEPYLLRHAQQQILRSEVTQRQLAAMQMAILDALQAKVALINNRGVILSVNAAWYQADPQLECTPERCGVGQNYLAVCDAAGDDEHAANAAAGIRSVLAGGVRVFTYEYPCNSPSCERWFQMTATPLDNSKRGGAVIMHVDVTDRHRAEQDLARVNRALRMLSAANAALVHAVDEAMLLQEICDLAVEVGYRMAWVGFAMNDAGRSIVPACHAGYEMGFLTKVCPTWEAGTASGDGPVGRSIRQGTPMISTDISQDATVAWQEACAKHGYRGVISLPLRDAHHTFGMLALYLGEIRPITDDELELLQELADNLAFGVTNLRAQSERQRIQAAMREQASLIDKAHDAIVVYGTDCRIRFWNASAERVYGWLRDEALGQSIDRLIYPADKPFRDIASALLEQGEWRGQVEHRRRDGTQLTVEGNWTLVRDEHGQPDAVLSIATDITHQLALEEQLNRAQRLDSIGQLTGGVAHDFNNLLTVILGNAELLSEELADNPDLAEMASMTVEAAQQGAELTHRLLAFARRQTLAPRSVNVNQLVGRMDALLRRTLSEAIDIRFELDEALWDALVDPSQLEGALLNLCINARDAMPDGGRLAIRTANVELDAAQLSAIPDLTPGCYVSIEVIDSGQGIPPQHLSRVFDPFFTTKGVGKGTGLGLSMVYGFVKQSLGHIAIESETGRGTTIRMLLPRTEEASAVVSEVAVGAADFRGTETILLVEDNALVRHHCHSQLAELGYTVIAVADGPEALRTLVDHDDIGLLFTDVIMPGGMTGREVADAARARKPGLRVLFTSGYSEDALTKQGRLEAGTHLLAKPYRRVDLARKVRAVLDERDA